MSLLTRIPTLSSQLWDFFYQTQAGIGTGARDVTENQPPQTQGFNALTLAEYIIDKDQTNPYYDNAKFLKNNGLLVIVIYVV